MTILSKIKLLFKIQKPANEIIDAVKQVKKTKKWVHFAVTILGTLLSTAAALGGAIPVTAQLVIVTVLQALYNIMRGLDKADDAEVRGTLVTTEFWMTGLSEIQKALLAAHDGGISAPWMTSLSSIVAATLAFGQNLAARKPTPEIAAK